MGDALSCIGDSESEYVSCGIRFLIQFIEHTARRVIHWGRVTHICVSKSNIVVSDNGLSLDRRQAIIWTNAGILLIRPFVITFSEILIAFYNS